MKLVFAFALVSALVLLCCSIANGQSPTKDRRTAVDTTTVSAIDQDQRSLEETAEQEFVGGAKEDAQDGEIMQEDEDEEVNEDEIEFDDLDDEEDDEEEDEEADDEEDDEEDGEPGRELRRRRKKKKCRRCLRKCKRTCSKVKCFADCPTQCKSVCSSNNRICQQRILPGPCKAFIPSWGYDSKKGKCVKFVFGGCKGNDNRFSSRRACKRTCMEKKCLLQGKKRCPDGSFVSRDISKNCAFKPCLPILCTLDMKQCPDGSFVSRDPAKNCQFRKCPEIECGPDTMTCSNGEKLFRRKSDCKFPDCTQNRFCKLPIETGKCKARFQRWAYDQLLNKCVKFVYGGCGGNSNNFETREDCENACPYPQFCLLAIDDVCPDGTMIGNTARNKCEVEPCSQCFDEIDPGLCKAAFVRYGYNSKRQRCERFIWGGCNPNGNNFETMEACVQACRATN